MADREQGSPGPAATATLPAVVFVTPDAAGRGGIATVVRSLLDSPLAQRYALATIVTHRVGSAPARVARALRGLAALAAWCVRHPGGIVHIHAAMRGSLYRKAAATLLARALRHPVVLQIHAGPGDIETFAARLGVARHALLRTALRRADALLSVSDASADALRAAFGPLAIEVIRNAAPAAPDTVGEPDGATVLYLGGFANPVKGGDVLVRALAPLLADAPAAQVVLAGPGEPPPALVALLGERVRWRGWLDDGEKAAAFAQAAITVLPSTSEGLPLVVLEAMSYGRAIVATRVGGVPDTLTDGVDGVLVDPGDADALATAIGELARDPGRVRELGAAARARACDEFGIDGVVARLDAIYRGLV